MSWDERQLRMLAAMGVRVWAPADADGIERMEKAAEAAVTPPAAQPAPAPALPVDATPTSEVPIAVAPIAAVAAMAAVTVMALPRAATPAAPKKTPADAAADPALAARAAVIAGLDWPALKASVAGCTACALCATRRQTVFGVGHAGAHWMVVGEAPGEQEDLAGEPFVGPAGQLLDQMLRAVGQSRRAPAGAPSAGATDDEAGDGAHRVYIANALKCRPPRNRNPEPGETSRCLPYLKRQIELVQPRLILALGRFAVKAVLDSDEAIGKLRGRVHRADGIPVVVSYHPAYLLRALPEKARAWQDLCLARSVLDGERPGP